MRLHFVLAIMAPKASPVKRGVEALSNPPWDQQLREIGSAWFAHVLSASRLSAAEIGRLAGVNETTINRLRLGKKTSSGATMDAIAKATGVPVPLLYDGNAYGKMYDDRHPSAAPSDTAAVSDVKRLARQTARRRGAAGKPRKRRGGGEKS